MSKITVPAGQPLATFPGGWSLHRLPPAPSASILWPMFKLINSGPRRWGQQRVYRLGWSPLACRFRRDGQGKLLAGAEPELYGRVGLWLELERDRSWLEQFFTADEIDMEHWRITGSSSSSS